MDADRFDAIYRRYHPQVRAWLVSKVKKGDVADDLASEVFLRAWRRSHTVYSPDDQLDAWLQQIAKTVLLDHWKHSYNARRPLPLRLHEIEGRDLVRSAEDDVVDADESARLVDALLAAAARLTAEQRTAVLARVVEEASAEDIAERVGRGTNTTKSILYRGRTRLRRALAPEFTGSAVA